MLNPDTMRANPVSDVEPAADAYHVFQIRPPGYVHADALTELAECVCFGLRRLGLAVFHREPPAQPARQIVLGAHLLTELGMSGLPATAIIYNSEQIFPGSPWLHSAYLAGLKSHEVWDYSAENVGRLRELGVPNVRHVPLGFVPELARIAPAAEDIDVLFYGCVNDRRKKILDQLEARGLKVMTLSGTYGEERDGAIGRAKVVLCLHYYEAKVFEIVRVAYLLSNEKAVVAEWSAEPAEHSEHSDVREALCAVPYEGLVEACVALARDPARRQALGQRARRIFSLRREEDILAAALAHPISRADSGRRAAADPAASLPQTLQLGSGKDFRPDCFNVDINPAWGPDAVLDITSPTLVGSRIETSRFGIAVLAEESFETAMAHDVLEHLPDLTTAMTNVLRLLKPGGIFDALVPYDLSWGAWQDPTHVRAFNERSWLYYTDWHWYLGWKDARFDLITFEARKSAWGVELQRAGKPLEEILRTPRAVDAMRVRLRKRYLQESERREALRLQPGRREDRPTPAAAPTFISPGR
ncbi:MAG TPA: methyltransferase domain-containing protein [Steroidobacteraceae bacterium]|nr:methyltransferase domain-containing protein [Steroidobacteraceae bacterium]